MAKKNTRLPDSGTRARRFDVVLIDDDALRACLDAIRLIANPHEKRTVHITVRGPFKTPPRRPLKKDRVAGSRIYVSGVGRFIGTKQSTVFLSCDSPTLREVWLKKDFGYNPHLTLYDGDSSSLARGLYIVCWGLDLEFSFRAGPLVTISSRSLQTDMDLGVHYDASLVRDVTGVRLPLTQLYELSESRRLRLISSILVFVANTYGRKRNGESPF